MNLRLSFLALSTLGLALLGSAAAYAQTLNTARSGWIRTGGVSSAFPGNQNYAVGILPGGTTLEYRNFFVFDLTGVNSLITSATLNLYNPSALTNSINGYGGDATETFTLTSTSTAPSVLASSFNTTDGQTAFGTLGTGSLFASVIASTASNGQTLQLSFNAAGLAYLNANLGQQVAFGGRLTTLGGANPQHLFIGTNPTGTNPLLRTPPVTLTLQQGPALTPEVPGSVMALPMILAAGGMALYQRKKKSA